MSDSSSPTLLWIRRDFRLDDNSALVAAIEAGGSIIPVFIWDPDAPGNRLPGEASRWWLHQSLVLFSDTWRERGGRLILRQGDSLTVLRDLIRETGAGRVYWNRRYEPVGNATDLRVRQSLLKDRIGVGAFNSSLLIEPDSAQTGSGNPYQVFTPFWKAVSPRPPVAPATVDLNALRFLQRWPRSESLESLSILPRGDWHAKLARHWTPGEDSAKHQLDLFLRNAVRTYDEDRDRPDRRGTSALSPFLHWGQIGPRAIIAALIQATDPGETGPGTFMKEIYWREFAHHILHHFPHTPIEPLRPRFANFPWQTNTTDLRRWQNGQTGYPIVDAGMRQLWETGWMHNRVRMITSSVLVKHLLIDWREGARWFWDTLVDADLANNTLGWQWSAGCGADAAPYFRIFNPLLQARKFDPEGTYVRHWVPELGHLPNPHLHAPWEAPETVLQAAGVRLGTTYPFPLIDLRQGRERALKAFAENGM